MVPANSCGVWTRRCRCFAVRYAAGSMGMTFRLGLKIVKWLDLRGFESHRWKPLLSGQKRSTNTLKVFHEEEVWGPPVYPVFLMGEGCAAESLPVRSARGKIRFCPMTWKRVGNLAVKIVALLCDVIWHNVSWHDWAVFCAMPWCTWTFILWRIDFNDRENFLKQGAGQEMILPTDGPQRFLRWIPMFHLTRNEGCKAYLGNDKLWEMIQRGGRTWSIRSTKISVDFC